MWCISSGRVTIRKNYIRLVNFTRVCCSANKLATTWSNLDRVRISVPGSFFFFLKDVSDRFTRRDDEQTRLTLWHACYLPTGVSEAQRRATKDMIAIIDATRTHIARQQRERAWESTRFSTGHSINRFVSATKQSLHGNQEKENTSICFSSCKYFCGFGFRRFRRGKKKDRRRWIKKWKISRHFCFLIFFFSDFLR